MVDTEEKSCKSWGFASHTCTNSLQSMEKGLCLYFLKIWFQYHRRCRRGFLLGSDHSIFSTFPPEQIFASYEKKNNFKKVLQNILRVYDKRMHNMSLDLLQWTYITPGKNQHFCMEASKAPSSFYLSWVNDKSVRRLQYLIKCIWQQ